jgi:hypothetical protein
VSIDVPEHTRVQQGATLIYIKQPVTLPHRWALPIDQIAEYYRQRALTYIFAPKDICQVVGIAAEKLIYETYGLEFEQREFLSEGVEKSVLSAKECLSRTDYYKETPALRLKSDFLLSAAAQEKIAKVIVQLEEFRSFQNEHVTPARVSAFLMQFDALLQPTALDLLCHLKVVEPITIVDAICRTYKAMREKGSLNILLAPLGNLTDSASHLPYYFKNSPATAGVEIPTVSLLNDNTIGSADHLILFDDNINTGYQTLNIVAEWLSTPLPSELTLHESHVSPLRLESQERLKRMPVHFVYGVGQESMRTALPQLLARYLHFEPVNISITLCETLTEDRKILTGKNSKLKGERVALREFLEKVGASLLESGGATRDSATRRALGDDGAEALVVFPYNVPSMTITAIWCSGEFEGRKWLPLCERRRNRRPDGTYSDERS